MRYRAQATVADAEATGSQVEQLIERLVQSFFVDAVFAYVQASEESLVDGPAALIAGLSIQLGNVRDELKRPADDLGAGREIAGAGGEFRLQGLALGGDRGEALSKLAPTQASVGGEIEQVLLLMVEARQTLGELRTQQAGGLILVG